MPHRFKAFMLSQIKTIDIAKWLEGCEKHEDPGEHFILKWIKDNAKDYREKWFSSACSSCAYWESCGHQCLSQCDKHNELQPIKEIS
jgi:hypothetical protein